MKVLIFAHSSFPGGAATALRYLVRLIAERHEVEVMLPSVKGSEHAYYGSLGIKCHTLQAPHSLPHFSSTLLHYASLDLKYIAQVLAQKKFDFAVSNTIAILHGALIAQLLDIPHLYYAHEYLADEELLPTSISKKTYLKIIEECSSGIISCSNFIASQFSPIKHARLRVVEPYDFSLQPIQRIFKPDSELVLQLIGIQSHRKNICFAVTLAKSLTLRECKVRLEIIGSPNNASSKLGRTLHKRKTESRIHNHMADPYSMHQDKRVVTLVCAGTEPYGLTIPESLRRAIPVIATRSGGPEEILPDDLLYDVENLDGCTRLVERVFKSYNHYVKRSEDIYASLMQRTSKEHLIDELDKTLLIIRSSHQPSCPSQVAQLVDRIALIIKPPLDLGQISKNISSIANLQGIQWQPDEVEEFIIFEKEHPGTAVAKDMHKFDVVPFSTSTNMDDLYKNGLGLSIELASTFNEPARFHMAAFIVCALNELNECLGRPPKILALGDGIGIDSMRLASCGFDVDYMDFDQSNMSKVAQLNVNTAFFETQGKLAIRVVNKVEQKYDAIVCLEVIEHVPQPENFATSISEYLLEGGLLFISDCFNGLEDRWQTHLYTNERYSGMLAFVLARHFSFVGTNKMPFGKPFVFRKSEDASENSALNALFNRSLLGHLINNQLDIGI